jgi:hypothetical protein
MNSLKKEERKKGITFYKTNVRLIDIYFFIVFLAAGFFTGVA